MTYYGLEDALSFERFGRYLTWASGDRDKAIDLYTLNTQLSESLYTPLQMLEVTLRNRIHTVMTTARHEGWFHDSSFLVATYQQDQLAKAVNEITQKGKQPAPGRVVAELTFGFWTAMFGADYENLWQTTLHRIASRPNGAGLRRKDFSSPLGRIRFLRNRIAHHEPILQANLKDRHSEILELTGWLSPAAAAWCQQHDRFALVYPSQGIILA